MTNRRLKFRRDLCPTYQKSYDALCGLLPEGWQPCSGLRTFEQQAFLYAQGRSKPGPIITKAGPGLSLHNYGLATDWDYFWDGRYTPLTYDDPRWKEYMDCCEKVGLKCISWEKPHNELDLLVKPSELLATYQSGGMEAVWKLVEKEHGNGKLNLDR